MKQCTASPARNGWRCILPAMMLAWASLGAAASATAPPPSGASLGAGDIEAVAIATSQAALGAEVGALRFLDQHGTARSLDEFLGRPVLLSLIYTACVHSCQVATRQLDRMVRIARNALGADSFVVLTIGFDQPVDTPTQMGAYARRYGISDPHWHFLSSPDRATIDTLMETVGFLYQESPRGFDHTVQLTILDREGRVWRQVYGEVFPTPQLVEPLKSLVWNRPIADTGLVGQLGDRVRLFCTVYDAQGDRYIFDYSLFAGIFIGVLVLGTAIVWLLTELRSARRRRLA